MTNWQAQELAELRGLGDHMQSEADRLLAWVNEARQKHSTTLEMPYEVEMAALGLRDAIERWTSTRIDYALNPTNESETSDG